MSLKDLAALAPIPCLDAAVTLGKDGFLECLLKGVILIARMHSYFHISERAECQGLQGRSPSMSSESFNVELAQQQCLDMSARCINLLLALREGMQDQPSANWATELEKYVPLDISFTAQNL